MIRKRSFALLLLFFPVACTHSGGTAATQSAAMPALVKPGERVPSEDAMIPDFHSLGLINGKTNIFRSACPVRDIAKRPGAGPENPQSLADAKIRMQHLYDLGIRTIVSLEDASGEDDPAKAPRPSIAIEKAAAQTVGITYILHPMANSGPGSLETLDDAAVLNWIEAAAGDVLKNAESSSVLFHCSAGHDRTGMVNAYLRIKLQNWSVDAAIDEMRRYGHNWPKYSNNGGISSWHEQHLRAIFAVPASQP